MHVKVKHGLTRSATMIDNSAVTFEQIALARELRGNKVQLAEDTLVLVDGVIE
jgi:hypothetical protein